MDFVVKTWLHWVNRLGPTRVTSCLCVSCCQLTSCQQRLFGLWAELTWDQTVLTCRKPTDKHSKPVSVWVGLGLVPQLRIFPHIQPHKNKQRRRLLYNVLCELDFRNKQRLRETTLICRKRKSDPEKMTFRWSLPFNTLRHTWIFIWTNKSFCRVSSFFS